MRVLCERTSQKTVKREYNFGESSVPTLGEQGAGPGWEVGTSVSRARLPLGYYFSCYFHRAPSPLCTAALSPTNGSRELRAPAAEQRPSETARHRAWQEAHREPPSQQQAEDQGRQVDQGRRSDNPRLVLLVVGHRYRPPCPRHGEVRHRWPQERR